ncbi:MAG TPA: DUF4276 family protein [Thermoanaerobaculia bacterium]|nr:DUF4276 family protein [Thermoanaerobaculia bacterium]
MRVKLYIEGGGKGELADVEFRAGWNHFFKAAGLGGRMPRVVRGGSRERAFDLFARAVQEANPEQAPALLVDSEKAVRPGRSRWHHLKEHDGWTPPHGCKEEQLHLMVQVMETWFLADRGCLRSYFGADLRERHLPDWPDLEAVAKSEVLDALDRATAACGDRKYGKGRTSFELLERLNPAEVEARCPSARSLLAFLRGS